MVNMQRGSAWMQGRKMRVAHFFPAGSRKSLCGMWVEPVTIVGFSDMTGECMSCRRRLEPPKPPEPIGMRDVFVIGQMTDGSLHMVVLAPGERGAIKELLRQMHDGAIKVDGETVPLDIYYRKKADADE